MGISTLRNVLLPCMTAALLSAGHSSAMAQLTRYGVTDDLWDVNQGTVVTAHSGMLGPPDWHSQFYAESIFGYYNLDYPSGDGKESAIFGNGVKGTVHWVEWETPAPITLRSFMLGANHDHLPGLAERRGFSRFTLYAADMTTGLFDNKLFELFPANPYRDTVFPPNAFSRYDANRDALFMFANVEPTLARNFRAEFVQFGDISPSALGPRINELDGFDTFYEPGSTIIPEPSSAIIACGLGVIGLMAAGWRRRRDRTRC